MGHCSIRFALLDLFSVLSGASTEWSVEKLQHFWASSQKWNGCGLVSTGSCSIGCWKQECASSQGEEEADCFNQRRCLLFLRHQGWIFVFFLQDIVTRMAGCRTEIV